MTVRFWGVRGSSPRPIGPEELRDKLAKILHHVKPEHLQSSENQRRFLSKLPAELLGIVGGNTACIELRTNANAMVVFDTGTGLRDLEQRIKKTSESIDEYHIFLSHFHYDHLLGLPYFGAMYNPRGRITFYSPFPHMEQSLKKFMVAPYHPVGWDSFAADIRFRTLQEDEVLQLGETKIEWIYRNHPNGCSSYKASEAGKSFIYSTDTELTEKDFQRTEKHIAYFQNADAIVLDTQYTLGEAIERYNWGHSSYSLAVEFAREFGIRRLYLFHHDPLNSDATMEDILKSARLLDKRLEHRSGKSPVIIDLAREGHTLEL